jgi:general secretion pathway protein A
VHNIEPLNEAETAEYVKYRLRVAGTPREIFTGEAVRKIYHFSKGHPRLINTVCDLALVTGYSENLQTIGPKVIQECSKDLSLPGEMIPQAPGRGGAKARPRRRMRPISWARGAIFAGLALVLLFFGFSFVAGNLGLPKGNLQGLFGTLMGVVDRNWARFSSEKNPKQVPEGSAPSTPFAGQSAAGSGSGGRSESSGQGKRIPAIEKPPADPFQGGRLVIPFGYNANELPPEAMGRLDELVGYLLSKPQTGIVIKGYTDAQGDKDYNRTLSAFRANVVKSYLAGKGISPNRMRVLGMGDESPRQPNTTGEGRSANRRVEIELGPSQS